MNEPIFNYEIRITGKLRAADRAAVDSKVRKGIFLSLELHDSVEDLTVTSKTAIDEFRGRFQ